MTFNRPQEERSKFWMLENYAYGLDENQQYKTSRFCFEDGRVTPLRADLKIGKFYLLKTDYSKLTVFGF